MCPRVVPALLCAAAAAATSHVVDNFTSTEGMFTLTSQVPFPNVVNGAGQKESSPPLPERFW